MNEQNLYTRSNLKSRGKFTWTIQDYEQCVKSLEYDEDGKKCLLSATFLQGGCVMYIELVLYNDGQVPDITLCMKRAQDDNMTGYGSFTYYNVNSNKDKVNTVTMSGFIGANDGTFFIGVIPKIEKNSLHNDGSLVIVWEFEVFGEPRSNIVTGTIVAPQATLASDMSELLKSAVGSDITLVATGTDGERIGIPAHSLILSARSPVFAAMFNHNLEEKISREVVIEDVDSDTITAMLQYIYSGEVSPDIDVSGAQALLACADKYQLTELKVACEGKLMVNMTIDNVAGIFILAHLHNSAKLVDNTLRFITNCIADVRKTPGWKTLSTEHRNILVEKMPDILAALGKMHTKSIEVETERNAKLAAENATLKKRIAQLERKCSKQ